MALFCVNLRFYPGHPLNMLLLTIKCLFLLEGLLLSKFSPRILLEGTISPLSYASAYILAFSWIWFTDRSRKFSFTVSACLVLSMLIKYSLGDTNNFFYVFVTAMIIPLTCAFTMMQCNPRKERELWALQYVWLIIGRLLRNSIEELINRHVAIFETVLTIIFVGLAAGLVPWIQQKSLASASLDGSKVSRPVQVHTPLSKLLGQARYLAFLVTVLVASIHFFYTRKALNIPNIPIIPGYISFITEIVTCLVSYFLVPHRIPPQAFFLLAQLFICIRYCIAFSKLSAVSSEILSSIGFTMTALANAQIVATHGKPGLEFTTCALVDICRNGIAPALFVSMNFNSISSSTVMGTMTIFFLLKYFVIDYKFDVKIKK